MTRIYPYTVIPDLIGDLIETSNNIIQNNYDHSNKPQQSFPYRGNRNNSIESGFI